MKKSTINDVAKLAKVSKSTVSKVINGKGYVSGSTREEVLKAIKVLNYIPNHIAQSLGRKTTGLIGFMYPIQGSEAVFSFFRGAHDEALKNDMAVVSFETNFDLEKERKVFEYFNKGGLDGLIIVSCVTPYEEIEKYNINKNIVCFQNSDFFNVSSVNINIELLLAELIPFIKKLEQRYGVIISKRSMKNEVRNAMINSYKEITGDESLKYVVTDCSDYDDAYKAGLSFLDNITYPTVIWTDENENGAGLKKAYLDNGKEAPIVISIGYRPLGKYSNLNMIDGKAFEAGSIAYNLIGKSIEHIKVEGEFKFEL